MRTILYRKNESSQFENYVDIGYVERDYYFICIYLNGYSEDKSGKKYYKTYEEWYSDFKTLDIGPQLITLNFYFNQYNEADNKNYFGEVYGIKTLEVLNNNLQEIKHLVDKWFPLSPLFNGLDLGFDDIDDLIESTDENENGVLTSVFLTDGSEIKFNSENDKIQSFYVPESEFQQLKLQVLTIVEKFH
jgi:hypothetical protein